MVAHSTNDPRIIAGQGTVAVVKRHGDTVKKTHTDADGTVHGEFRATGLRPRCLDEMIRRGIQYDTANFDPSIVLMSA